MKAVIITGDKYPCEDAGAIREHAIAKILESLGHDVLVLGYGEPTNKVEKFDGISYTSFRPRSKNIIVRVLYRLFFVNRVIHYIKNKCRKIDKLLVVDIMPGQYKKIQKLARRYHSTLIHDSVEWYSSEEFTNGTKNRLYKEKEYVNTVVINDNWRVIAISTYLEEHFSKRCDKVARIPVIMDIASIESNLNQSNAGKVRFSYVGSPGRKDYLREIIEGFSLLSDDQLKKIEFNIVGVNLQQLESVCGVKKESIAKLNGAMVAHGRLPHDEAIKFVKDADYTVLFRDASLRYAKAGFPTKIVESLACGTPPVCNLSSDLGMYLKHGENAILADGHTPEQIKKAVESAILIPIEERKKLRRKARETAEKCFDYRQYISEMDKLLK